MLDGLERRASLAHALSPPSHELVDIIAELNELYVLSKGVLVLSLLSPDLYQVQTQIEL